MFIRCVPTLVLGLLLATAGLAFAFAPQPGDTSLQTPDNNSTLRDMLITGQGLPEGVQIGDGPAAGASGQESGGGTDTSQGTPPQAAPSAPKAKYGDIIIHRNP